jgi:hypothetical protein
MRWRSRNRELDARCARQRRGTARRRAHANVFFKSSAKQTRPKQHSYGAFFYNGWCNYNTIFIPTVVNVANYCFSGGYTSLLWPGLLFSFQSAFVDGSVNTYAVATANAIADGGYPTAYAYGQAIANAEPGSENWRALVAATAAVFCNSADSANAWSAAIAVAVEVDGNKNGCQLLTDAYAAAVQQCGQGLFTILDGVDQTTARVLQNCGLIDGPLPSNYGGKR